MRRRRRVGPTTGRRGNRSSSSSSSTRSPLNRRSVPGRWLAAAATTTSVWDVSGRYEIACVRGNGRGVISGGCEHIEPICTCACAVLCCVHVIASAPRLAACPAPRALLKTTLSDTQQLTNHLTARQKTRADCDRPQSIRRPFASAAVVVVVVVVDTGEDWRYGRPLGHTADSSL